MLEKAKKLNIFVVKVCENLDFSQRALAERLVLERRYLFDGDALLRRRVDG